MDRALNGEYVAMAFDKERVGTLPSAEELTGLIAELEIELVRGLMSSGKRQDLAPLRRAAWYLHGIASTTEDLRYPVAQRRRAFAVSAHVLDLLLEHRSDSTLTNLIAAFAAQVGYFRADESPNAGAIYRKMRDVLASPAEFIDGPQVALQAGILFLGMDIPELTRRQHRWRDAARELAFDAGIVSLDDTMFASTDRLLRGIEALTQYLREGKVETLQAAGSHFSWVLSQESTTSDLDTRWVVAHISAVADMLSESSIWAVLPADVSSTVKQAFTLGKQPVVTLWPPQRALLSSETSNPLDRNTSRLLVSVPTSAGKTLLAQIVICAHAARDEGAVCYVTPLRSLGREMRQALKPRLSYLNLRLGADLPDGFGTNDNLGAPSINDEALAAVEVMTPERLMNALRQSPNEVLSRFTLFVIDEAHLMAQPGGRGLLLEGLLTLLDANDKRVFLLSGVMGNAASVAAWTSAGRGDVLFTNEWRAPRRLHILASTKKIEDTRRMRAGSRGKPPKTHYDLRAHLAVRPTPSTERELDTSKHDPVGHLIVDQNGKRAPGSTPAYRMTANVASYLLRAGSLLMVVSTRALARNAAQAIAERCDEDPRAQGTADSIAARLGAEHPLVGCVRRGVAYHHAGLPIEVQEEIEDAVRSEVVRAVVATTTLTDGVNLPVRTVILAPTEHSGQDQNHRLTPAQLLNAVGRAGRAGKESEGWIVLALSKRLAPGDFDRLTPSPDELEVHSTLASNEALESLAEAEDLVAATVDGIMRVPLDRESGGFVSYVWFVLHALNEVPALADNRSWQDTVMRLFAFTELPDDLKDRWLMLAARVADKYEATPVLSRRRWAQSGTSLRSAASIEQLASSLADETDLLDEGELTLEATLKLLAGRDVYSQLLALPEGHGTWKFRRAPNGDPINVNVNSVVADWVNGSDFTSLAADHIPQVKNKTYRLEQMVDAISSGMQHYLAWTIGLVISQANSMLLERLSSSQLYSNTAAHLRYGVDSALAIRLLVGDIKSRRLALDLGRLAERLDFDDVALRDYLIDRHIAGWRAEFAATPAEVLDLLQYVDSGGRHKLGDLLTTGEARARVVLTHQSALDSSIESVSAVAVRENPDGGELQVSLGGQATVGVVAVHDHGAVAAVLESGLRLDLTLEGTTLIIRRADPDEGVLF
ncbi:DEAD/DEAH box helicase (plasmid) [Coraliomargarita sp. W4R53]